MRRELEDLPRPDPTLHQTGSEGHDGHRGRNELRTLEQDVVTVIADGAPFSGGGIVERLTLQHTTVSRSSSC